MKASPARIQMRDLFSFLTIKQYFWRNLFSACMICIFFLDPFSLGRTGRLFLISLSLIFVSC